MRSRRRLILVMTTGSAYELHLSAEGRMRFVNSFTSLWYGVCTRTLATRTSHTHAKDHPMPRITNSRIPPEACRGSVNSFTSPKYCVPHKYSASRAERPNEPGSPTKIFSFIICPTILFNEIQIRGSLLVAGRVLPGACEFIHIS